MSRFLAKAALFALALAPLPVAAQPPVGRDAEICSAGRPSILVNVMGFNHRTGNIRVALYGEQGFLQHGETLRKVNLPVSPSGPMRICIAVPHPGRYAIALRHDVNGDNASNDWNDGGGFSRNPHLSLLHLRPSFDDVAVTVGNGVLGVNIVLLYRYGLSIHPASG